ncbi:TPA: RelA/SpoT domain-containing protein [Yersinia enterocolitica]|uniref:RelA/SpoT domain-containing protein n=1 Tax=Yersinia enterocolitica TaxID=630 RepID=UPI0005FCF057|nr:RelA/SpoT domain-containing protein [Yersinia enterocolitica]EKN5932266.1 (p)ppGpp synthetase [Yersinia enterocolitica]ELY5259884.1 (p)ppGpp synthetase [Yersinia enterocolitica]CRE74393.1 GTP pyrophosphokinase ywaC [Yersinia enterocolitica]HDL6627640.1 (p)ppGpp synthetase [Yersinia enterocolitica]HDL6655758.1 (p)ppGpp synthetase [Yersinia enterocolitica]
MDNSAVIDDVVEQYKNHKHIFDIFIRGVVSTFSLDPRLNEYGSPVVHSIKSRLKNENHLKEKLLRKWDVKNPVTTENLFYKITDLAGVRILHLYQDQLSIIHDFIMSKVDNGDWVLNEHPVAYSWDPESQRFFEDLNLKVEIKESYYTSIHYVIRPPNDEKVKCEIQVRTLFEEIWGEIDHTINYPRKSTSLSTKEQLRVLSKLVSTGTRLADSIFRLEKESKN